MRLAPSAVLTLVLGAAPTGPVHPPGRPFSPATREQMGVFLAVPFGRSLYSL